MTVITKNTTYTITDIGDGGFLIRGNAVYCPRNTVCRITTKPEVGDHMAFIPSVGPFKDRLVVTTRIHQINL